jgi:hypothetical protein
LTSRSKRLICRSRVLYTIFVPGAATPSTRREK